MLAQANIRRNARRTDTRNPRPGDCSDWPLQLRPEAQVRLHPLAHPRGARGEPAGVQTRPTGAGGSRQTKPRPRPAAVRRLLLGQREKELTQTVLFKLNLFLAKLHCAF